MPFNSVLLYTDILLYAHINVKIIFLSTKYITKSNDQSTFILKNNAELDEIRFFKWSIYGQCGS